MRTCGTCSMCCRWPSVPDINKPAKIKCQHLHNKGYGCSIYENRPSLCEKYQCSWLRGIGDEEDQPNNCYILIDRRSTALGVVLIAKTMRDGAYKTSKGQDTIKRAALEENMLCFLTDEKDSNLIIGGFGPDNLLSIFRQITQDKPFHLSNLQNIIQDFSESNI